MPWNGEYEPTRPPSLTLGTAVPVMALLRLTSGLVTGLLLVGLVMRGLGLLLPATPLLAYTVPLASGEMVYRLNLVDVQRGIRQAVPGRPTFTAARWLPDGSGFVVRPPNGDPFAITLSGLQRPPTERELRLLHSSPAPDGSAYVESRAGQLLVYHPDWIVQGYPLAEGRALNVRDIAWSPDSRRLGLIIQAEGSSELREVAVVDIQSGRMQIMTAQAGLYTDLSWTPDGERLAFIQSPSRIHVLGMAAAAGLTVDAQATVDTLAWAPVGNGLVYATRDGAIYRVASVAQAPDLLLDGLDSNTELVWSADGDWLAVSNGSLVVHDLWLYHLPTRRAVQVQAGTPAQGVIGWQP
jgi:hypothetical protein